MLVRSDEMKFSLFIDKEREEEVILHLHEKNRLAEDIERICREDGFELIGYKNKDAVRIDLSAVACFIVEDGRIYAVTEKERLLLKHRLYVLEERLDSRFIKINQSCIANIKQIERFDTSIGGSLTVKFKNGYKDYVSRRCLKAVKERLGL